MSDKFGKFLIFNISKLCWDKALRIYFYFHANLFNLCLWSFDKLPCAEIVIFICSLTFQHALRLNLVGLGTYKYHLDESDEIQFYKNPKISHKTLEFTLPLMWWPLRLHGSEIKSQKFYNRLRCEQEINLWYFNPWRVQVCFFFFLRLCLFIYLESICGQGEGQGERERRILSRFHTEQTAWLRTQSHESLKLTPELKSRIEFA